MNELDFAYHWENLGELDPDQLVSDLGLTALEIRNAFRMQAIAFIEREFG